MNITCGQTQFALTRLTWDTLMLGRESARIENIVGTPRAQDGEELVRRLRELGLAYVTVRRPQEDWQTLVVLQDAGFVTVDGILAFTQQPVRSENGLRLATAADSEPVAELAARSFVYSRFHNDPKLSPEIARRVHYEWARNSVLGQAADAVWVSEARGQIVGFITARLMGEVGSIVLIAVDPAFAGQGHGKKLVAQAQNWFAEKGVKRVEVQTQTANLPALALYFHTGFRLRSASFTLRWSI